MEAWAQTGWLRWGPVQPWEACGPGPGHGELAHFLSWESPKSPITTGRHLPRFQGCPGLHPKFLASNAQTLGVSVRACLSLDYGYSRPFHHSLSTV